MTTTLITGANRGLGFEVARRLAAEGHQVWIGARDEARGAQAADAVGARFVRLDVTDEVSVAAAAERVEALDVLVNNAGISGGRIGPSEATADHMRTVYETNVFGPVRVLRAFIPLLKKSAAPVVVNVSSGPGSLGLAADPDGPWLHRHRFQRPPRHADRRAGCRDDRSLRTDQARRTDRRLLLPGRRRGLVTDVEFHDARP